MNYSNIYLRHNFKTDIGNKLVSKSNDLVKIHLCHNFKTDIGYKLVSKSTDRVKNSSLTQF